MRMRLGNVRHGGREPCTDGPDRLIGDDSIGSGSVLRDRSFDLPRQYAECFARFPLVARFAHANDCHKARSPSGGSLGGNIRIALAMVSAAFRMTDDYMRRAAILQHWGSNIARARAK